MNRRGISIPIVVALAIVLFYSGTYAFRKYRLNQWRERIRRDLVKTKKVLSEAIKGASYPFFDLGGKTITFASKDRGIWIYSKRFEKEGKVIASVSAGEKQRTVATFYNCLEEGKLCQVIFYRLYLDTGKALGDDFQYIADLYLEKNSVSISAKDIGKLKTILQDSDDVEIEKLVDSVTRVRFTLAREQLNSISKKVNFEVLCVQPELKSAREECKGQAEIQVKLSFKGKQGRL